MNQATIAGGVEFRACSQFNPMYSITGHLIRCVAVDERQAEAAFLTVLPILTMGLVILHLAAWTYMETYTTDSDAAGRLWTLQVVATMVVVGISLVGWSPRMQVRIAGAALTVQRGEDRTIIPASEITAVYEVDALRYHRDYRPYAEVHTFAVRAAERFLVAKTDANVYGIAFKGPEQKLLVRAVLELVAARHAV